MREGPARVSLVLQLGPRPQKPNLLQHPILHGTEAPQSWASQRPMRPTATLQRRYGRKFRRCCWTNDSTRYLPPLSFDGWGKNHCSEKWNTPRGADYTILHFIRQKRKEGEM